MNYQIGQTVDPHQDYESSNQCFICGKELKEENIELLIALTENRTLTTASELDQLSYGTDWSPRIGKTCLKKFPKESIIEEILI